MLNAILTLYSISFTAKEFHPKREKEIIVVNELNVFLDLCDGL